MSLFKSKREKRYWFWAFIVLITILSTLVIGQPLANQLRDQNVQAVFFSLAMLLMAAAVVVHGLKTKPSKTEWATLIGVVAVYVMFFVRLGAPERSHLMEYSILAIFIHKALVERMTPVGNKLKTALLALSITFIIGVLDEVIQIVIPNRVFDPEDIVFNGMAATMTIVSVVILNWVRSRFGGPKPE